MENMKIGIIREGKVPPDLRAPLVPYQCKELMSIYPGLQIFLQPADFRCFSEEEYVKNGVKVQEDLSDCDILLGIKEVPIPQLIPGKKYLFFSHTIKKQAHNRSLLREIIARKIELIDYESLTWEDGHRILGFGRFAGIVGAHNAFITWGRKYKTFTPKPAHECRNYLDLKNQYRGQKLPVAKIALCGDGRVAHGCLELFHYLKIRETTIEEFLKNTYDEPVFVHLRSENYYRRKDGREWDKADFYHNPEDYESTFKRYYKATDIMVNAVFWKQGIPPFFTREEMKQSDFKIRVIADITCDINGPIPSTLYATTIEDPVYGYHVISEKVQPPYLPHTVDVMAVGNLPCELPVDASVEFGESIKKYVIPHLLNDNRDEITERATITRNGKLTPRYAYLEDYIA
jgi:saccharopine dehydrogenase (NAD+, L-lysine-forming)